MRIKTADKNIKIYILYGILFDIVINLYKPFSVKFLERIGGTDYHISLYNALPGLLAVFAIIPGTLWVRKFESKKKITAGFFLISRLFILMLACIPLLPPGIRPMLFVLILSMMNFPDAIAQSALQSFLGDIFPSKNRATAIAMRNKFSIPAVLLITLITGQILTKLPQSEHQRIFIYQIFFVLAFLVGLVEIFSFMTFKESYRPPVVPVRFKEALAGMIQNKNFVVFFTCSLLFHFGWQMGWPLFSIYQIGTLRANEWWLAINAIVSFTAMFFSYSYWNRMIARRGSGPVLAITTMGMALTPILFALSPTLYVLAGMAVVTGFFTSGTTTVLLSGLLESTPEEDRVVYIGVYNTVMNISLTIAPLVGHMVLQATSIYTALIVTAVLRCIGSIAFFVRSKISLEK